MASKYAQNASFSRVEQSLGVAAFGGNFFLNPKIENLHRGDLLLVTFIITWSEVTLLTMNIHESLMFLFYLKKTDLLVNNNVITEQLEYRMNYKLNDSTASMTV